MIHETLRGPLRELEDRLAAQGIRLRVVSTYRTREEQARLYAQGRTVRGDIVTYARPGESPHNYGLAIDVLPVPDTSRNWKRLRKTAADVGFSLLGEWDPGHLQHPQWPQVLAWLRKKRYV